MYYFPRFFLIILGLFLTLTACKNTSEKKIGYVLNQKVYDDFNGTKEVKSKLKVDQDKQGKILDSIAMVIKTYEVGKDQLRAQQNTDLYNRLFSQFSTANQNKMNQYSEEVWKQINHYMSEFGKEEGYDFIYGANGTGTIMYANQNLDISDKIITYINKKYAGK